MEYIISLANLITAIISLTTAIIAHRLAKHK